jgi:Putative zinc-finger
MSDRATGADDHVLDLLPGLINGTLDGATALIASRHLATCAACAAERAQWQALRASVRAATALDTPPSPAMMERIFAVLDAAPALPTLAAAPARPSVGQRASAAGHFVRAQVLVVPRGVWAVSAVALTASLLTVFLMRTPSEIVTRILLSLIVPLVTALGTAFLSGPENDPALEVALATPVSPRVVAATRIGMVFLYNFGLASLLTLAIALGQGGGFAPLASLWFGPALLIGAGSLLLSVAASSIMGVAGAAILLAARLSTLLAGLPQQVAVPWAIQLDRGWTTSPLVLVLAVACLAAALIWTPREMQASA